VFDVVVEQGSKRTFASALAWPGWSRSARQEDAAIEALVAYGPRYAEVLRPARIAFRPPKDDAGLTVVERVKGINFGAKDVQALTIVYPIDFLPAA
jgi:hypothetical protein